MQGRKHNQEFTDAIMLTCFHLTYIFYTFWVVYLFHAIWRVVEKVWQPQFQTIIDV